MSRRRRSQPRRASDSSTTRLGPAAAGPPSHRHAHDRVNPTDTLAREATGAAQAPRRATNGPVIAPEPADLHVHRRSAGLDLAPELADLRHRTQTLGAELEAMGKQIRGAQAFETPAAGLIESTIEIYCTEKPGESILEDCQELGERIREACQELGERSARYLARRAESQRDLLGDGTGAMGWIGKLSARLEGLVDAHASSAAMIERLELGLARLELEARP